MNELTEKEMNLVCLAATYTDETTAKQILEGTGLSLRGNTVYRGDKVVATTHVEQH